MDKAATEDSPAPACSVELIDASGLPGVPPEALFADWVKAALRGRLAMPCELAVRVVSEAEAQQLNARFRGVDRPTNVLAFPVAEEGLPPTSQHPRHLGDLAICAAVVQREALEQSKVELHHWAHMTVHGVLHLLGFDHRDDSSAARMESLETRILARLGMPAPYSAER